MIGIAFLAAFMAYVFISALVIYLVLEQAGKKGRSPRKWGLIEDLVGGTDQ